MKNNIKLYPNVHLGKGCLIEDYVIIGVPPRGHAEGELHTYIGDNAVIRSHSVIYAGNVIGNNFQCGNKANIRECNEIGNDVSVGTLSIIEHHIHIEDGVRIHSQAFIPEYSVLEEECWIGPNVVFTNAKYPRSPDVKDNLKGPRIMKRAIICANSTLLPGVVVGEHAIVGAGSVVTKNVQDGHVVAGNPARQINTMENLPYRK